MDAISQYSEGPGYLQRLWNLRYFVLSLVGMDLRARYKRSLLGVGWSLVRPLAMTTVLCVVFCKLFNQSIVDYAPFLLCGLTIWSFLNESCSTGCSTFLNGAAYIRQQPIPLALFPLRTVLSVGFHAAIAFLLAIGLITITRGAPSVFTLLAVIPPMILLVILCWAFATLFGILHTHFPDTQHLMEIVFQILFYLTPIIYPPEMIRARERFAWLVEMNPFTHVMDTIRHPLLTGELASMRAYTVFAAFTAAVLLLSVTLLRKLERNLVFWI